MPTANVAVIGGGLGGIAAALACLRRGLSVVLSEETPWLGGQLTAQLVPLDEHLFIERTGANRSYRELRDRLRDYYRRNYPLSDQARRDPYLNPGAAWVSPVSVEPRVAVAVIDELLLPYVSRGLLTVVQPAVPVAVHTQSDRVVGVTLRSIRTGDEIDVEARYYLDATETGELLPLGGVEHTSGRESVEQTGEPHAAATADPTDMQAVTWCFVVDHVAGGDFTIDKPAGYDALLRLTHAADDPTRVISLTKHVDGVEVPSHVLRPNPQDDPSAIDLDHRRIPPVPDLWTYRRIAAQRQFTAGAYASDIVVVNWPQNDYAGGPVFGVPDAEQHRQAAKGLSQALLYWLQTEAPRPDGGTGWPGLRLRPDVAGSDDGFALSPYIRESRRIHARTTIREQDISLELRTDGRARRFEDTVGVGHYFWIDRHPTTGGRGGFGALPAPFQVPLGALVPVRIGNLLPAAKNIGTTQLTNGSYRLHPVEWTVGEASGALAAFCVRRGLTPAQVHESATLVGDLQADLRSHGAQLSWPDDVRYGPLPAAGHPAS
jgi:hypothetical protein